MINCAGRKFRLKLGINRERIQIFIRTDIGAADLCRGDIAIAVDRAVKGIDFAVAQILTHGEGVVELMREAIPHHLLTTGDLVIFLAFIEISRQFMRVAVGVVVRHNGAFPRQPAVIARIRIALEVTQEGKIGFIIRTPAEGRRNRVAGRLHHFLLRIFAAPQTGEAIRPYAVIVNRIAEVKPGLPQVIRSHFKLDFFQRLRGWALAHHTHHSARMAFTIQHGRWATQQFDALKEIGIHRGFRIVITLQLHAIQILVGVYGAGGGETTNRNYIIGR